MLRTQRPTAEHHRTPLGIGEARPRLSWTLEGPPDQHQHAYEISLTSDSGTTVHRVKSADHTLVPWPGPDLASRQSCQVRVRVHHDPQQPPGPWSEPLTVEAGLLHPQDWTAAMISPDCDDPAAADPRPAALLRHDFHLHDAPVASARLYATALGVHDLEINGQLVGDQRLAPGWSAYRERLRYQTHDVTHLLNPGANAWGAHLADGWYRGRLGFNGGNRDIYGTRTALLAQLEIHYTDGTTQTVTTGPDWHSTHGPVTATGILDGEHHDARREIPGWSTPHHRVDDWHGVTTLPFDPLRLTAPDGPPVRAIETLRPATTTRLPDGRILLDYGQNLVGHLRLTLQGPAGTTVTVRHAEVLDHGHLATAPLRDAAATDRYTLRGDPDGERWEPRFTFHGFRYAELHGWPGDLGPDDALAVVLHTDMERTGWFECSDPRLNQLHDNIRWSMRGNFLDVPTDCPQRDERLGWTGDAQIFAPTGTFLYDCAGPLTSWLKDLAADQARDPHQVPPLFTPQIPVNMPFPVPPHNMAMAGWGDAAVLVPWTLHQRYGDSDVLRRQYPSARAWVEAVTEAAGPDLVWRSPFQLGDWLDPTAPADDPSHVSTPHDLVATAYFAHSTRTLARTAALLGRDADHQRYDDLADRIRTAFQQAFTTAPGTLTADTQTAYALALCFDLLPEADRPTAGNHLARLVAARGHTIGTGFLGTPLVCDALTATGHADTAHRLLAATDCPSWLYAVDMGATTIWERWDSLLPDGTVNPGEMTSFNHYAFGAVADWMHRTLAGLAPEEPGYRVLRIAPRPGGTLTWARAEHRTPHGTAAVHWHIDHNTLTVTATVPHGCEAIIDLPGQQPQHVGPGTHTLTAPAPADGGA
ncbi:family 78 glycoside hydrolase catalytic domain [Kitasatospora sp. NPDC057198]|uniref:family 78 glycoside hydrolase catalytic domain n=1 Tax=Kitasatospora sp. NPDC057198 TaxID=3346046 RepID=UPI00362A9267